MKIVPYLSIVIPAFNEEKDIVSTLETVDAFLEKQAYAAEILVVNNGSTDNTHALAEAFACGKDCVRLIRIPENVGKGAAIREGFSQARGQVFLFSDADLSTPIEEANALLRWMEPRPGQEPAYDVVIASRRMKGARLVKRQPFYREGSGRLFSLLVRLLVLGGFLDTQCGFKMFTRAAAGQIFPRQTINGFGFDVEILFIAVKKLGLRVREVPVEWRDAPNTKVRLLTDSLRMFGDLFLIRRNSRLGRYD